MLIHWNLPIRVYSEPNLQQHWAIKHKRFKEQKLAVWVKFHNEEPKVSFPCRVKLTRYGVRELDYDNLVASFKAIRDEVANQLIPDLRPGQADSSMEITWEYKQEKAKEYSVDIDIEFEPVEYKKCQWRYIA